MKKHVFRIGMALMLCMMVMSMGVMAQAKWQPRRPINLIVPWGPGGASDLTARIVAAEMEASQRIIITNTLADPAPSEPRKCSTCLTTATPGQQRQRNSPTRC